MEALIGDKEQVFLPLEHDFEDENGWKKICEELSKEVDCIFLCVVWKIALCVVDLVMGMGEE